MKNTQKIWLICFVCLLGVCSVLMQACSSGKSLQKLTQSQRMSLLPSPLEMHGGNIKGSIQVAVPTKIIQQYKKKKYELKFYFSDYPYSEKESYLLELGRIDFEKTQTKGEDQVKEISFEFPFQADKSEGNVLAKVYFYENNKQKSIDEYLLVGKGIIQTAALFRSLQADTLLYLPQTQKASSVLWVPFSQGSETPQMDATKQKVLEILANSKQKLLLEVSCSPEGKEAKNFQLVQKRAEGIKEYLKKVTNDPPIERLHSLKEIKLNTAKLLDNQSLGDSEKQEIKEILQSSQSLEDMDKRLQKKPYYSQIANELYPLLRYARLSLNDTTTQEVIAYQILIETENNPMAHHNLGLWYWKRYQKQTDSSNLQKALYHLETAANIDPKAETLFNLIVIYQKLNQPKKSEQFKAKLLATNSEHAYLQEFINHEKALQLALTAQSSKDEKYQQALALFEKAGNSTIANANKALAALLTHQYDKASTFLEKNQDDALSLYLLAVVEARKGNQQQTLSFLKKALQKDEKLKLRAKKDLEFELLRENKSFLDLLK